MGRFIEKLGLTLGLMAGGAAVEGNQAHAGEPGRHESKASLSEEHIEPGKKDFDEVDRKNADTMYEVLGDITSVMKPVVGFTFEKLTKRDPSLSEINLSGELENSIIDAFVDHFLTPAQKLEMDKIDTILKDRNTPATQFKVSMIERLRLQKGIILKHLVGGRDLPVLEQVIREQALKNVAPQGK